MSLEYLNAALHLRLDDAACKAVLIGLANHTDAEGRCWPGIKRLMLYTSYCERAVRSAVRRLEAMGLVETIQRPQKTSIYYLRLNVGQQMPEVVSQVPQGGASGAAEPLLNPQSTDASDARAFDDDWIPKDGTISTIMQKEGLTLAEINREVKMFVLKCQAGQIPAKPDAAFKVWCARLKDLKHEPKAPPAPASGPAQVWDRDAKLASLRKTRELYERMGRIEDLEDLDKQISKLEASDDDTTHTG